MRVKKEINLQIGEQVKTAREAAHLTQEQFAERIEVSPQFVSDLERGVVGISLATLKRICIVLGISSDQILFGHSEPNRMEYMVSRCKGLTEKQISILADIIDKFIEAMAPN